MANDELQKYIDSFKTPAPSAPAIKPRNNKKNIDGVGVARIVDDELKNLGWADNARRALSGNLGRENSWDINTIFNGHDDPANDEKNLGIISWQKDRRTHLISYLKQNGGDLTPNESNLRLMARFLDDEMQNSPDGRVKRWRQSNRRLKSGDVSLEEAYDHLEKYIAYQPQYRSNNYTWQQKAEKNNIFAPADPLQQYINSFKGDAPGELGAPLEYGSVNAGGELDGAAYLAGMQFPNPVDAPPNAPISTIPPPPPAPTLNPRPDTVATPQEQSQIDLLGKANVGKTEFGADFKSSGAIIGTNAGGAPVSLKGKDGKTYRQTSDQTGLKSNQIRIQSDAGETSIVNKKTTDDGTIVYSPAQTEEKNINADIPFFETPKTPAQTNAGIIAPVASEEDFQAYRQYQGLEDNAQSRDYFRKSLEVNQDFGKDVEVQNAAAIGQAAAQIAADDVSKFEQGFVAQARTDNDAEVVLSPDSTNVVNKEATIDNIRNSYMGGFKATVRQPLKKTLNVQEAIEQAYNQLPAKMRAANEENQRLTGKPLFEFTPDQIQTGQTQLDEYGELDITYRVDRTQQALVEAFNRGGTAELEDAIARDKAAPGELAYEQYAASTPSSERKFDAATMEREGKAREQVKRQMSEAENGFYGAMKSTLGDIAEEAVSVANPLNYGGVLEYLGVINPPKEQSGVSKEIAAQEETEQKLDAIERTYGTFENYQKKMSAWDEMDTVEKSVRYAGYFGTKFSQGTVDMLKVVPMLYQIAKKSGAVGAYLLDDGKALEENELYQILDKTKKGFYTDEFIDGSMSGEITSGFASAAQFLLGGYATRGSKLATVIMGAASQMPTMYEEMRSRGISPDQALLWSTVAGVPLGASEILGIGGQASHYLEQMALGSQLKKSTLKVFLKDVAREVRNETAEEFLQETGQNTVSDATINALSRDDLDGLGKILEFTYQLPKTANKAVPQGLIAGLTGGVFGGGGAVASQISQIRNSPERSERRRLEELAKTALPIDRINVFGQTYDTPEAAKMSLDLAAENTRIANKYWLEAQKWVKTAKRAKTFAERKDAMMEARAFMEAGNEAHEDAITFAQDAQNTTVTELGLKSPDNSFEATAFAEKQNANDQPIPKPPTADFGTGTSQVAQEPSAVDAQPIAQPVVEINPAPSRDGQSGKTNNQDDSGLVKPSIDAVDITNGSQTNPNRGNAGTARVDKPESGETTQNVAEQSERTANTGNIGKVQKTNAPRTESVTDPAKAKTFGERIQPKAQTSQTEKYVWTQKVGRDKEINGKSFADATSEFDSNVKSKINDQIKEMTGLFMSHYHESQWASPDFSKNDNIAFSKSVFGNLNGKFTVFTNGNSKVELQGNTLEFNRDGNIISHDLSKDSGILLAKAEKDTKIAANPELEQRKNKAKAELPRLRKLLLVNQVNRDVHPPTHPLYEGFVQKVEDIEAQIAERENLLNAGESAQPAPDLKTNIFTKENGDKIKFEDVEDFVIKNNSQVTRAQLARQFQLKYQESLDVAAKVKERIGDNAIRETAQKAPSIETTPTAVKSPDGYTRNEAEKRFFTYKSSDKGLNFKKAITPSPFQVEGLDGYDFFVHKEDGLWNASEGSTGNAISAANETPELAIERATKIIKENGKEKLDSLIARRAADYGLSPRYSKNEKVETEAAQSKSEENADPLGAFSDDAVKALLELGRLLEKKDGLDSDERAQAKRLNQYLQPETGRSAVEVYQLAREAVGTTAKGKTNPTLVKEKAEEVVDEPKKDREFSSTQVDVSPEFKKRVLEFSNDFFQDEDLTEEDGIEDKPHFTAFFGLNEAQPSDEVKQIARDTAPFEVTLGKLGMFDTNPDFDVVFISADSPELNELNRKLSERPNGNEHKEFKAHHTLAYVKKGEGQKYVKRGLNEFVGEKIKFDALTFSAKDRTRTVLPFEGEATDRTAEYQNAYDKAQAKNDQSAVGKAIYNAKRAGVEIQKKSDSEQANTEVERPDTMSGLSTAKPKRDLSAMFDKKIEQKFGRTAKQQEQDAILSDLGDIFGFEVDKPLKHVAAVPLDETKYQATKPVLERAIAAFDDGSDVEAAMSNLIDALSEKIPVEKIVELKPYILRFLEENFPEETKTDDTNQTANDAAAAGEAETDNDTAKRTDSLPVSGSESAADTAVQTDSERSDENRDGGVQPDRGVDSVESKSSDSDGEVRRTAKSDAELRNGTGQRAINDGGEHAPNGGRESAITGSSAQTRRNFTITNEIDFERFSPKTMFRSNVEAIRLIKTLANENRSATFEEQQVLAKYIGFGGLAQAFKKDDANWGRESAELKNLLTKEEYEAARASTRNAHYTSKPVVTGMWEALRRFGVTDGVSVIEPSMGSGNFFGLMPADMRSKSSMLGVELDNITGAIAQQLYPEADIYAARGFETVNVGQNKFDVAIGNPPFGQEQISDKTGTLDPKQSFNIHGFFFAKTIEAMRPGGVAAMVVSRYFMDNMSNGVAARQFVADRAKLLGAIRLPSNAFKGNAGTDVVTDIIFLQKLEPGESGNSSEWMTGDVFGTNPDGETIKTNKYFLDHPEMVVGEQNFTGKMNKAPNQYNVVADLSVPFETQFARAIENLPKNVFNAGTNNRVQNPTTQEAARIAPNHLRPFSFVVEGDKVMQVFTTDLPPIQLADGNVIRQTQNMLVDVSEGYNPGQVKRLQLMIPVRDTLRELYAEEGKEDANDARMENLRAKLNRAYDAFQKEFGYFHNTYNKQIFKKDTSNYALLLSLEEDFDKGITKAEAKKDDVSERKPSARKSDIFTRRKLSPQESAVIEKPQDALLSSLNLYGRINSDYMIEALPGDYTVESLRDELGDAVFDDLTDGLVTADEFLSGDVKTKFEKVTSELERNPNSKELRRQYEALEKVIPADIPHFKLRVKMSENWIPNAVHKEFFKHLIGDDNAYVNFRAGRWFTSFSNPDAVLNASTYGTPRKDATSIIQTLLSGKRPAVFDTVPGDAPNTTKQVINQADTAAAEAKAVAIEREWAKWLYADEERRDKTAELYNSIYNRTVNRTYTGAFLQLAGKVSDAIIALRPHQKNAIWRAIQDGKALFNHVVGAGKSFVMIATGMEMRRLGLMKKPLYVVPNHLVEQFGGEFLRLYPNANVLVAGKSDMEKSKRQQIFARIGSGDWDAVIVSHSSFQFMKLPAEEELAIYNEQIDELVQAIEAVKSEGGKDFSVKDMERTLLRVREKIAKLAATAKDDLLDFAEMGIDGIFVDESQEFKNLFYTTTRTGVKGMGNAKGSQKAFDMFAKTQYILRKNRNRNVFFATGTPVSNSLVEIYNVQRYLQYDRLKQLGVQSADAWLNTFGVEENDFEMSASGRLVPKNRLAYVTKKPELQKLFNEFTDTIRTPDLKRDAEAQGKRFPLPNHKRNKVVAERSDLQASYIGIGTKVLDKDGNQTYDQSGYAVEKFPKGSIVWRLENWQKTQKDGDSWTINGLDVEKKPEKEIPLVIAGDARKAGLDYRLIDDSAPDFAGSKLNLAVGNIYDDYVKSNDVRGTQLVFCDLSVPAKNRGEATAKMREKVPEFFTTSYNNQLEPVNNAVKTKLNAMPDRTFFTVKEGSRMSVYEKASGLRILRRYGNKSEVVGYAEAEIAAKKEDYERIFTEKEISQDLIDDFALSYLEELERRKETAPETEEEETEDSNKQVSVDELLADSGKSKFSVYDDVKAKLIARGIPANEIAFIHDYNTDVRKQQLFDKVNRGDIRILLGSTQKMGAGMNVQQRLVSLHNLDSPYRPSDMEQRLGRIIRQGNKLFNPEKDVYNDDFSVNIYNYATSKTYDARMYELIEQKGKAFDQFYDVNDDREIPDVSEETASSEEMKAESSGDPRILELARTGKRLKDLKNGFEGWQNARYDTERNVKDFDKGATWEHRSLKDAEDHLAHVQQFPLNGASIEVDGITKPIPREEIKAGAGETEIDADLQATVDAETARLMPLIDKAAAEFLSVKEKELKKELAKVERDARLEQKKRDEGKTDPKSRLKAALSKRLLNLIVDASPAVIGEYRGLKITGEADQTKQGGRDAGIVYSIKLMPPNSGRFAQSLVSSEYSAAENVSPVKLFNQFDGVLDLNEAESSVKWRTDKLDSLGDKIEKFRPTLKETFEDEALLNETQTKYDELMFDLRGGNRGATETAERPDIVSGLSSGEKVDKVLKRLPGRNDADLNRLEELSNISNIGDILNDIAFGVDEEKNVLEINPETSEIIRAALEHYHKSVNTEAGKELPFDGILLEPVQIGYLVKAFNDLIQIGHDAGYTDEVAKVRELGRTIKELAKKRRGTVSVAMFSDAIPHEKIHQGSVVGSMTENDEIKPRSERYARAESFQSDKTFQTVAQSLNQMHGEVLPLGHLIEEAFAYLGTGDFDLLGVSEEDGITLLMKIVRAYATANGEQSLKEFSEVESEILHQSIEREIYANKKTVAETEGGGEENYNESDSGDGLDQRSDATPELAEGDSEESRTGTANADDAAGDAESEKRVTGDKKSSFPQTLQDRGYDVEDIDYTPKSHADTESAAMRLEGLLGVERAVNEALTGNVINEDNMRVLLREIERKSRALEELTEIGNENQARAVRAELSNLVARTNEKLITIGRSEEIVKTIAPLSTESALIEATRLKQAVSGDMTAELTDKESAKVIELQGKLKEIRAALGKAERAADKFREKYKAERKINNQNKTRKYTKRDAPVRLQSQIDKQVASVLSVGLDEKIAALRDRLKNGGKVLASLARNDAVLKSVVSKRFTNDEKSELASVAASILHDGLSNGSLYGEADFTSDIKAVFGDSTFTPIEIAEIRALGQRKLDALKRSLRAERLRERFRAENEDATPEEVDQMVADYEKENKDKRDVRSENKRAGLRYESLEKLINRNEGQAQRKLEKQADKQQAFEEMIADYTDSEEVAFAMEHLLTEKGKSIDSVVNAIRAEFPDISTLEAVQFAKTASDAIKQLKADKEAAKIPVDEAKKVAFDAEQAQKVAMRRAEMDLRNFLSDLSDRKNLNQRVNNLFRTLFVANISTQIYNAVQSYPNILTETFMDVVDTAIRATRRKFGVENELDAITPPTRLRDVWRPFLYTFAKQKQTAEKLLSDHPEEFFKVFSGLQGDVSLSKTTVDRSYAWLPFAHKGVDAVQSYANFLAKWSGATLQENNFRAAAVTAHVNNGLLALNEKDDTGATKDLKWYLENGNQGEIKKDLIEQAVERALRVTFAVEMHPEIRQAYDMLDRFLPVMVNPVVYARFTYTVAKSVANAHLFGAIDAIDGTGYTTRSFAKGVFGYAMVGIAYAMMAEWGGDDDDWSTLYLFGKDNPPVDVKRWFPLSAYFFTAHQVSRLIKGKGVSPISDFLEAYTSTESEMFKKSPGYQLASAVVEFGQDPNTGNLEKVGRGAARMSGNVLAVLIRYLKPFRDAYAEFDAEERAYRVRSGAADDFVYEMSRNLPYLSRGYGGEKRIDYGTGKPIEQIHPSGSQFGLRFVNPAFIKPEKSEAEEFAAKLVKKQATYESGSEMSEADKKAYDIQKSLKDAVRSGEIELTEAKQKLKEARDDNSITKKQYERTQKLLKLSEIEEYATRLHLTTDAELSDFRLLWSKMTEIEQGKVKDELKAKWRNMRENAKPSAFKNDVRKTFQELQIIQ